MVGWRRVVVAAGLVALTAAVQGCDTPYADDRFNYHPTVVNKCCRGLDVAAFEDLVGAPVTSVAMANVLNGERYSVRVDAVAATTAFTRPDELVWDQNGGLPDLRPGCEIVTALVTFVQGHPRATPTSTVTPAPTGSGPRTTGFDVRADTVSGRLSVVRTVELFDDGVTATDAKRTVVLAVIAPEGGPVTLWARRAPAAGGIDLRTGTRITVPDAPARGIDSTCSDESPFATGAGTPTDPATQSLNATAGPPPSVTLEPGPS